MENFLSKIEILSITGWSETKLANRIKAGLFPTATHRCGHRKFWEREAVLNAMQNQIQPIV